MEMKPKSKSSLGPWIDSHSHWASPKLQLLRDDFYQEAFERGLTYFIQAGINPQDWKAQLELKQAYPQSLGLCFGLHPEWISSIEEDEAEAALNLLPECLPKALALGECGLDFRPQVVKQSHDLQVDLFRQQLELASVANKPVILHLVQAHEEALRILDFESNPIKGYVHGFNGSAFKAKEFTERGWALSIGASIVYPKNERLRQAVLELPLEFLLIETDSPDQPPPDLKGQINPFVTLFQVAECIGRLRRISMTEVLDISKENLKRILSLQENSDGTFEPIPRSLNTSPS